MTLDIVERHLSWSHAEVIGPKEKHRNFELLVKRHGKLAAMEDCVVHHEHGSHAPVRIFFIEVADKFHDEE